MPSSADVISGVKWCLSGHGCSYLKTEDGDLRIYRYGKSCVFSVQAARASIEAFTQQLTRACEALDIQFSDTRGRDLPK